MDGEQLVAQVYVNAIIEILFGQIFNFVVIIATGIVDQNIDAAELLFDLLEAGFEQFQIGHIAEQEQTTELAGQFFAGNAVKIEEGYFGALADIRVHQLFTDTAGAAGDHGHFVFNRVVLNMILVLHGECLRIWLAYRARVVWRPEFITSDCV